MPEVPFCPEVPDEPFTPDVPDDPAVPDNPGLPSKKQTVKSVPDEGLYVEP